MSKEFFTDLGDALVGFLPRELRGFSSRLTSRNIKVWYEEEREHYEVQRVGRALEVGFHAEHTASAANDDALERILSRERTWRRALGRETEAGPNLGRPRGWTRVSEVWKGGDLVAPETAIEAAERLATYIAALEPARRRKVAAR